MKIGQATIATERAGAAADGAPDGDGYLSYEEFLQRADEDIPAEWVDGRMMLLMPASNEHQDLQRFLLKALDTWAEVHDLGIVRGAPFQMKLETRPSGREPDILFVARENLGRLRETFLDGPADLVAEIISPESRERDCVDKFSEYEAGGVREYWLLDPQNQRAEWHQRGEDGLYQPTPAQDGVYHSAALAGFWMREEWLWQRPKLLDVLRAWKLI